MTKFYFLIASEIPPATALAIVSLPLFLFLRINPETPLYSIHEVQVKSPYTKNPFTFTFRLENRDNVIGGCIDSWSGRRMVVKNAMNQAVEDLCSKSRRDRKFFRLICIYKVSAIDPAAVVASDPLFRRLACRITSYGERDTILVQVKPHDKEH
ncbi:hypothetical protein CFE70_006859 [Pyrenophora teres f. teres 0-1]